MEKKKVVAYIRVRKNEALSVHKEFFKKVFANRDDSELVDIYWDAGVSGLKNNRSAFAKMIADAEAGEFDYIVVKSLAKLSRDVDATIEIIRKLKEHGVGIYSITERLDTLSTKCEKYIELMEATAELRKQLTERERELATLTEEKSEA